MKTALESTKNVVFIKFKKFNKRLYKNNEI